MAYSVLVNIFLFISLLHLDSPLIKLNHCVLITFLIAVTQYLTQST